MSRALLLLSASWATSTTLLAWRMFVSPIPGEQPPARPTALLLMVVAVAVGGGLLAALAFRRRWAYILWLCLFALSLLSILSTATTSEVGGSIADAPAYTVGFVLALSAQVAGVALLLRRSSREWYGIDHRPAQPGEWCVDPSGRHQHRYWDGSVWTEYVADDGVAGTDPLPEALGGVPPTRASSRLAEAQREDPA